MATHAVDLRSALASEQRALEAEFGAIRDLPRYDPRVITFLKRLVAHDQQTLNFALGKEPLNVLLN